MQTCVWACTSDPVLPALFCVPATQPQRGTPFVSNTIYSIATPNHNTTLYEISVAIPQPKQSRSSLLEVLPLAGLQMLSTGGKAGGAGEIPEKKGISNSSKTKTPSRGCLRMPGYLPHRHSPQCEHGREGLRAITNPFPLISLSMRWSKTLGHNTQLAFAL